jgi:hypothetical protein
VEARARAYKSVLNAKYQRWTFRGANSSAKPAPVTWI